jgi:MFS family permease
MLIAVLGAGAAFTGPGYSALVPSFVATDDLAKANSIVQTWSSAASIAGPFVGGLLVAAFGQSWPMYIDAITFAVLALGTLALRHDRTPSLEAHEREHQDLWAGVRLIYSDPLLRAVTNVVLFFVMALSMVNIAEVFFITQTLHASTFMYGMSGGVFGVGLLIGAIFAGQLPKRLTRQVTWMFASTLLMSVCFTVVGFAPSLWWVFPPLAIAGIANGLANVAFPVLYTVRSVEAIRGRVFAAVGTIFTATGLLAVGFGGIATTVMTPRGVFIVAGVVSAAVIIGFAPYAIRVAHRDELQG